MKFLVGLLASAISLLLLAVISSTSTVYAEENSLNEPGFTILISEIQIVSQHNVFVELYNYGDEAIDISDWQINYKPGTDGNWVNRISAGQEHLEHMIKPESFFLLATQNFINDNPDVDVAWRLNGPFARGGAHIKLITTNTDDTGEMIVDLVGWGDADSVFEGTKPAAITEPSQSISRCFNEANEISNSGDNSQDFIINEVPLPGNGIECPEPINDDENTAPVDIPCESVVLSEIFSNPAGAAAGKQFIELHNPTSAHLELDGCGLQTTHNNNVYWFSDEVLTPGEYRAFYDGETNIWLTISSGGTVFLLGPDEIEIDSQTYPASMPNDSSWAWFSDNSWSITYAPTPGLANISVPLRPCPEGQTRNPDTNRCRNIVSNSSAFLPDCGPGRERNPETNRCRNVTSNELVDCGPGRERNPDTNRCRNITTTGTALSDCGPGRERNPDTNRCRLISAAASTLQPCAPGQERNPETNRCRRVATANDGAIAGVMDIESSTPSTPANWYAAGIAVLLATLFALWEWRHDVRNLIFRLRHRPIRS